MDTPLISVLIPAYNVERYLPECLDSILSQSEGRIEVLVADDGSTDGTVAILERRAAADGRLRFLRLAHAGAYAARNRLLAEAKGEWIYLCDADDKLAPGAFSRLLSVAEKEGLDAIFFGADVIYDSEKLEDLFPTFRRRYSFSRDLSAPRPGPDFFCDAVEADEWRALVWLMLVRREMLERNAIRFEEGQIHEDDIFGIDVALHARKAARIPDHLYFRRVREESLMTSFHPVEDFVCYARNALWILGRAQDGGFSTRTRVALATTVLRPLQRVAEALTKMTDAEKERLAADHPLEAALARIFSKTRSEEDFLRCKEAVILRNRKIRALKRKLEAQRRENERLRSSLAFRIEKALLAIPRRLFGRKMKRIAKLFPIAALAAAMLPAPAAFAQGVVVDGDPAPVATVVTSAVSQAFFLDTREGPRESDGTETLTFSTRWHGMAGSSVKILQSGAAAPVAEGLVGESNFVWRATVHGSYTLTHATDGPSDGSDPETATFIVRGLYPDPSATLRWKYAKNANGWFCAQVALPWHPGYAAGITNMRLLFADRHDAAGRLSAYLVDPATAIDPLGTTETYRDIEYRVARIDLDDFSDLGAGDRAVYGVSDATMASPLDSVPSAERLICLRVPNRQLQTVEFLDNKIAWLAWDDGGERRFLPLVGSWSSSQTAQTSTQFAVARPMEVDEVNAAEAFGLPLPAVAVAEVTCRIASIGFGGDGSVEGVFEIAAEDAAGVMAESGELSGAAKLTVLGATSLGGSFEPIDPAACGVELLSRRPPYAFRVKAPGDNAFFKVRLEAENVYE